jgi:hypothetical protein
MRTSSNARRSDRQEIQCFQRRDLFTLDLDQAPEHHIEQKGCDAEKDRGRDDGKRPLLSEFVFEEAMGRLV